MEMLLFVQRFYTKELLLDEENGLVVTSVMNFLDLKFNFLMSDKQENLQNFQNSSTNRRRPNNQQLRQFLNEETRLENEF